MKPLISTDGIWPSDKKGANQKNSWLPLLTFVLPAAAVVVALFLLIRFQGRIENSVAGLALLLPVGYALAAGMVASVNPCGVMMLSSYAFYQARVGSDSGDTVSRVLKGLLMTAVITLGFVVIFAGAGLLISAGGQWLVQIFPYAGLVIGVSMALLGIWLLATRKTLGIAAVKGMTVDPGSGVVNALLFGITYAIASLSCTLPVFLVVVGSALASGGVLSSFVQFIGYALGMGLVVLVVVLGAALFRRAMAQWLRTLTPHIHRLSALFLVGAGIYLVYYWLIQSGLLL